MRLSLVEVTGTEPFAAADLAGQLRIDPVGEGEEAEYLEATRFEREIKAARELFEDETGRQVVEATWQVLLDGFPRGREPMEVPRPPLQGVTKVEYLDSAGALQTWDSDEWEAVTPAGAFARPGWVQPKGTNTYPLALRGAGAVRITFTAGYENGQVPDSLTETLLAIAVGLYEFREPQVVGRIITVSPNFTRLMSRWRLPVMA